MVNFIVAKKESQIWLSFLFVLFGKFTATKLKVRAG